jgi:dihydroxy-acid dehydratase
MPEVGMIPIPAKLLAQGITDMVRISDARMSGTSFGAVVLHISPEAAAGGLLAVVQDGDLIELDVPNRRLELMVADAELARRQGAAEAPAPKATRGYSKLYISTVNQAHDGADLDFLVGKTGSAVPPLQH